MIAARWYVDKAADINEYLATLPWALVMLTGDEEGVFPFRELSHPNMRLWIQTPHSHHYGSGARFIGDGAPPALRATIAGLADRPTIRPLNWSYVGQINNRRREDCFAALSERRQRPGDGYLRVTRTFGNQDAATGGIPYPIYVERMLESRVVACPSGCYSVDTFRLFEALECGCVPICDRSAPSNPGQVDYLGTLFGEEPPFPILLEWTDFQGALEAVLPRWPDLSVECAAFWLRAKRRLAYGLVDDLRALGGIS